MNLVDRLLIPAMRRGWMTNAEIYRNVQMRSRRERFRLTPHWKATIRNTLQRHETGNPKCCKRPLFLHKGHGKWRLK